MTKLALVCALFLASCGASSKAAELVAEDSGTTTPTSETEESTVEADAGVENTTSKPTVKPVTSTDSDETETTETDAGTTTVEETTTDETETEETTVDAGETETTTDETTEETTVEETTGTDETETTIEETTDETETTEVDAGTDETVETDETTVEFDAGETETTEETTTDETTVEVDAGETETDETTVEVDAGEPVDLVCEPNAACDDDGNPCTTDVCSADGTECEHTAAPANTVCAASSCEDGIQTNAAVCGGQTTCQAATESDCYGACNAEGNACAHPVELLYAETDAPVWTDPNDSNHFKTTSLVSVSSNSNSVFVVKTNVETTLTPSPVQVRTSSIIKVTKDSNDADTIYSGNQVGAMLATDDAVYFEGNDGVNATINCVPADGGSPQQLSYGKTSMFVTNGTKVFWVDIDQTSGYSYKVLTTPVTGCSAPSAVTTVVTEESFRTILPTLVATVDYLYYVFQDKVSQMVTLVQLDDTCDYCQSGSANRNPNNSLLGSGGITQDNGSLYLFAHPETDNANANRVWTHDVNADLEAVETGAEMDAYWESSYLTPFAHNGFVYLTNQRASLTSGQAETWIGDEHYLSNVASDAEGVYFASTYNDTLNVFKASL